MDRLFHRDGRPTVAALLAIVLLISGIVAVAPTGSSLPGHAEAKEKSDDNGNQGKSDDDSDDDDANGPGKGSDKKEKDNKRGRGNGEAIPVVVVPGVTPVAQALTATAAPTPSAPPPAGSVAISAFACPPGTPPPTREWAGECFLAIPGATFELEALDGLFAGWFRDATTGDSGEAAFDALPRARYRLDLIGTDWCHAESNGVDADGNIVIAAGADVRVWIYTCR